MFGFSKRKDAKAQRQAGYDASNQVIQIVTMHVKEAMPAICEYYIDLLSKRLDEAGDDLELLQAAWDGFKAALEDVPRIVEENIREQYASAWELYKNAGMEHVLSGIIKQEVAAFTNSLPEQIMAQVGRA